MIKSKLDNQKGVIGLLAVMSIGVFALGVSLVASSGAASELVSNINFSSGDQAFYSAESGVYEGALQFKNDPDNYAGGSPQLLNNAVSGDIDATLIDWPYFKIRSLASGVATDRAVIRIFTIFPEGLAFDYAVYAKHNLDIGGSAEVNGDIFANDGIDFTGNNAEINGDAYSAGNIDGSHDNVNGETFPDVEPIPPPEIESAPYLTRATDEGTFFNDESDAENLLNGGETFAHVFIDDTGNAETRLQNASTTGFVYVAGDLQLTSGGNYTADENYAAIVVEGNLSVAGGVTINGIVYVKGSTTFGAGNNTINGSLISAGGISATDLTGNTTINFDPNIYANWENLEGLDTESTEEPKVILWEEE